MPYTLLPFFTLIFLVVVIFRGLDSWLWRAVWLLVAILAVIFKPFPGAGTVTCVALIIGIAFKNSLSNIYSR